MDKDFDFKVIGIAKAIKQERLRVPPNQREYSWLSDVQVRDFLQDISNALRTPDRPYFLGTIVLTAGDDGILEIADGQQRLATATMILAAIRDYFRDKGETNTYKSIETDYLFSYDRKAGEYASKLKLNVDDNEYFKNKVLHHNEQKTHKSSETRRSHKLITQAFESIKEYIKGLVERQGNRAGELLNDWIEYLENKANIVVLKASNAENAFMMFETLNDRGLKTSQVDLVKNHIFHKAGDRLEEAQQMWSSMKSTIESVSEDDEITMDFLRCACCIMTGQTTKKEIMRKIKDRTRSKTDAISVLALLHELSQDYAAIFNPDHPKWNEYGIETRKSIQVINLLGVTQIRPLMLAVAKYFNKRHTPSAFKKFVSWSVRFIVLNIKGGRLDEGYAKFALKIYEGEIKNTEQLSKEAVGLVVKDAEFKNAFETTKVGTTKLARYYLRALEISASQQENPEFIPNDDTVINLEHIMPASFDKAKWPELDKADAEAYLTRLGNMCLLKATKNSDAGNDSFIGKKKIYKESAFLLTNQLSELRKWDSNAIEKRQKVLAKLAVTTWPL